MIIRLVGLLFTVGVLSLFGFMACATEPAAPTEAQARVTLEETDLETLSKIRFYRHPKAHELCLGYGYQKELEYYSRGNTGGPIVIVVDCAKVSHLLVNE